MIYSRRIHAIYTYDSSRMDLLEYTVEMWRIAWLCIGGEKNAVCWCNAVHFGQLRRIRGLSYDLKNLQRNHHSMKSHRAYETMIYKIRNCEEFLRIVRRNLHMSGGINTSMTIMRLVTADTR